MHNQNPCPQIQTLEWQFNLVWRLAAWHLPALTDDMCVWEPAPGSWNVRLSAAGVWTHDWQVPEPDPAPPTTIGWLTWQMIWWWSGLLEAVHGGTPAPQEAVDWPGSAKATVERLEALSKEWAEFLNGLTEADLERPLAYPWSEARPLRTAIAWANSELIKNVAEIGVLHHLYQALRK